MPKKLPIPRRIHQTKGFTYEIGPVIMVSIVKNCARCGGDHVNVLFNSFGRKPAKYTHFGICPTTMEPILMISTPDKSKKRK